MCGIVAGISYTGVYTDLIEGIKRLEYRGYDSSGIALLDGNKLWCFRRKGRISKLLQLIGDRKLGGNIGIAHTRWATHGKPSKKNAHPLTSEGRVTIVHNGIVENHQEIKGILLEKGVKFESKTDSEVIVHAIYDHLTSKTRASGEANHPLLEAVSATLKMLKGTYAFCVIDKEHPNTMVLAKKSSTLVIGKGQKGAFGASDIHAIAPICDQFVSLENGDIATLSLKPETKDFCISIFDSSLNAKNFSFEAVDKENGTVHLGTYKNFMCKEINEQPQALHDTICRNLDKGKFAKALGGTSPKDIEKIEHVTLVACGSSYHAAMVGKYWIEEIAGLPCSAEIGSEFRYRKHAKIRNGLCVFISQSGETADILGAHEEAKNMGFLATLAISNAAKSSLLRICDSSMLTFAGTEVGVAATKTFTAQMCVLMILAVALAKGRLPHKLENKLLTDIYDVPRQVETALKLGEEVKKLAEVFHQKNHIMFIAREAFYPIACEGSLKLKEITYIHAESYPAGEMKHGPLALISKTLPSVALLPDTPLYLKTISNLEEIAARKGPVYILTNAHQSKYPSNKYLHFISIDVPTTHYLPIIFTIPLQLLAYQTALLRGTQIDHPRNLAKSVTVE